MAVFYPIVGFTGAEAFFTFYLVLSLGVLFQEYLAELVVFATPNVEVAEILGMLVSLFTFLFAGFSPPASELPTGVKWIYHINPFTYTMSALCTIVFGDCPSEGSSAIGCNELSNAPPSLREGIIVKEYFEVNFGMKHEHIWRNCGILFGIVLFIRVLTLLAMRFLNFQKK
ncbi:ATP-binding Cassette (ABC) Superfamily [Phytophthora infestans T30-4]|uniref:ATP-binding Cassette (ABC) Superfamily n=1 Tax=Phytophthora infestans (strain T30-4) TaxID=403677 RepID=D0P4A9_PHYIT|nr:ATP-binding Cassette (ABC) Superfamily [Phytophthora infestans T30-4]EEY64555.1 ATP-binding Cassette (ABC) Superfamily [Phytophthora infestans T30-4]|eukprot:XP_002894870.1 ATP-binding Cassette (ABC) Superfamily [Phytophthora infestans T30-4]